jgi:hypothetical protein
MEQCVNCEDMISIFKLDENQKCDYCRMELTCESCGECIPPLSDQELDIEHNCEECSELFCRECQTFVESRSQIDEYTCNKCYNNICAECDLFDTNNRNGLCNSCHSKYCFKCDEMKNYKTINSICNPCNLLLVILHTKYKLDKDIFKDILNMICECT